MKVKLLDSAGNKLRDLTMEGAADVPQAIVSESDPGAVFLLTQRDDPDGAQVFTKANRVVVLP